MAWLVRAAHGSASLGLAPRGRASLGTVVLIDPYNWAWHRPARQGISRLGGARRGKSGRGMESSSLHKRSRPGLGVARLGWSGHRSAWPRSARPVPAWNCTHKHSWLGPARLGGAGLRAARHGTAWSCNYIPLAWRGVAALGLAPLGLAPRGRASHGTAWSCHIYPHSHPTHLTHIDGHAHGVKIKLSRGRVKSRLCTRQGRPAL